MDPRGPYKVPRMRESICEAWHSFSTQGMLDCKIDRFTAQHLLRRRSGYDSFESFENNCAVSQGGIGVSVGHRKPLSVYLQCSYPPGGSTLSYSLRGAAEALKPVFAKLGITARLERREYTYL